jgi:hypothetical protein
MQFRTEIQISKFPFSLNIGSKVLSVGSCFANMIGDKLKKYHSQVEINPFGTIFNPISIFNLLSNNTQELLVERNDTWLSLNHHSQIFAESQIALKNKINNISEETQSFLEKANLLIITLGTAWVYELKSENTTVANCHKLDSKLFEKRLLLSKDISQGFELLLNHLNNLNPNIQIILSVSPVRHIKDTIQLNSVSKSILRTVCHELSSKYNQVHYFPAFEIMNDDLRDYRFYKSDLIHPNEMAEEYIWEKFSQSILSKDYLDFIPKWDEILFAINHKTANVKSFDYQLFVNNNIDKLKEFERVGIRVEKEMKHFKSLLL